MPKVLDHTLYCYVESANGKHARTLGKKLFGSFSNYVNALIAKDRGVKAKLGHWGKANLGAPVAKPTPAPKKKARVTVGKAKAKPAKKSAKKATKAVLASPKATLARVRKESKPKVVDAPLTTNQEAPQAAQTAPVAAPETQATVQ